MLTAAPWTIDVHSDFAVVIKVFQLAAFPSRWAILCHINQFSEEGQSFACCVTIKHIFPGFRVDYNAAIRVKIVQELVHCVVKVFCREANTSCFGIVIDGFCKVIHACPCVRCNALLAGFFNQSAVDEKSFG